MFKITFIICVLTFMNYIHCEFNLTIVHISDFHSHWFEFDENKHDCSRQEAKEGKCFGGFPRLLTFVRDLKKREKNVLVMSSGEFFLGRSLHALHGWKLAHALLPRLELDAMCLSNHDFDSGVFELSAFLYAMKFPVLCANMWARNTSYLYSRVNKSVVIDVGGEKIGIVGYIHRHALKKTKIVASVKFLPEIPALQEEVQRLESEGINKIIALGHAGYYTDLEIARKVKGVDIVIGGDSDIMLFDPGPEANESSKIGNIHGNYPRVHQHEPEVENDKTLANRTLVLHIPQHGMYVGVLRATFDDKGKIIHESGEPVLLDSSIPQDEETVEFLEFAKGALETLSEHSRLPEEAELLGKTKEHLDGNPRNCRMRECSLGNFIVDAFLHEFTFHYRNKSEHRNDFEHWGPIDAVVFNSGPIRRSIEPGYIRISDILKSVSLGGFIKRVYMSGKHLMNMMEHSVKHYDPLGVTPPGAFLQVAGLRVEYDLSRAPGNRVKSLTIRCRDCEDNNTYFSVKPFKTYVIGMPTFLRDGRDGFYDFEEVNEEDMGQFDALLIVDYLRRMFDIEPILDGRIKFYKPENMDLNLTLKVPPLLFGEPLPVDNSELNLHTDPIDDKHVINVSSDDSTSNENIDNESENNPTNLHTDQINEYVSKLSPAEASNNKNVVNESENNPSNILTDQQGEQVSTTYSEDISNNQRLNYELMNKRKNGNYENEHAFGVYANDDKSSIPFLDELHNSPAIQQKGTENEYLEQNSVVKTVPKIEKFAKKGNKSTFQHENDVLIQSITETSYLTLLPAVKTENARNWTSFLANNTERGHAKIKDFFQMLLNSTTENFSSTLEKMSDIIPGLPRNFAHSDVASGLKDRLIAKRSALESLKSEAYKINSTEADDYINFMETYLRHIFKDIMPIAESRIGETFPLNNSVPTEDVKTNIKYDTVEKATETLPEIDFKETVINLVKRILGEGNLMKMFNALTALSLEANSSVVFENHP